MSKRLRHFPWATLPNHHKSVVAPYPARWGHPSGLGVNVRSSNLRFRCAAKHAASHHMNEVDNKKYRDSENEFNDDEKDPIPPEGNVFIIGDMMIIP